MMHHFLQPEADGLPMRKSHPHVVEKLHYLRRYIDIFESSMHKRWHKRHYIDLFAGPGKCNVPETNAIHLGSPLLAITTKHPFTDYFFVDKDPTNIQALKQRCSISPLIGQIEFIPEDSNTIVHRIVAKILDGDRSRLTGSWSSLNLAFLDPDGLELQWRTVVALASVTRMDLIIHYPEMGLTRNFDQLSKAKKDTKIDLFFGSRRWRDIYESYSSREVPFIHRKLMDFYEGNLAALGYQVKHASEIGDEPVIRNVRQGRLYRLLFASKHPLGNRFWKQSTAKDAYGQRKLF